MQLSCQCSESTELQMHVVTWLRSYVLWEPLTRHHAVVSVGNNHCQLQSFCWSKAFWNAAAMSCSVHTAEARKLLAGSPLSVGDQFIAGLGAGAAGALIACPTELIKCRLQACYPHLSSTISPAPLTSAQHQRHGTAICITFPSAHECLSHQQHE